MSASSADAATIRLIRELACKPDEVATNRQVQSDLMAHHLTVHDICDAIVDSIDTHERVKPTVIKNIPGRKGQAAFELKPRVGGSLFYIKIAIDQQPAQEQRLVLLSAHPDH